MCRPPPSQRALVEAILRTWKAASATAPPVVQLLGPDRSSKQQIARQAAAVWRRNLIHLSVELLPAQPGELETLARLWQRESILLPLALYLDAQEAENTGSIEGLRSSLNRFISHSGGIFFVGTREALPHLGPATVSLDVARPTPSEQRAAWQAVLGAQAADSPDLLTGQFNLELGAIHAVARAVLPGWQSAGEPLTEQLWDACRARTRPRLDALAQRLEIKATSDDLVLPSEQTDLLQQIVDQVGQRGKVYEEWGFARRMNRGLGLSVLFAGESGTGKTMAAEVLADVLRLDLYRVDLSAVVSKYIGETEKNLRRVFDAFDDGGAILFLDEFDALGGKRTEVKDSHDRYANIEINYLLQRMEAYQGLAILATNMKSALDTAFLRRLRFIVNFPFPGAAERKQLWQKAFPPEVPAPNLDYDRLARLNLTGGSIHNVALNAAFRASQTGEVTMPLVLAAARDEFLKLDRPLNESDFHWLEPVAQQGGAT